MTDATKAEGLVALAERIELWPIDQLRPYERNPRTHSDDQVDRSKSFCVAQPTRRLGWTGRDLAVKRVQLLWKFQADGPWWQPGRRLARRSAGCATRRCDLGWGHFDRVRDG